MKKLHILIPSLLATSVTPLSCLVSLSSCGREHDYSKDYLTFTALEDGQLSCDIDLHGEKSSKNIDLWYSINNQDWLKLESNDENDELIHFVTYKKNDVIRLKGNNNIWSYYDSGSYEWRTAKLHFTGLVNASGNIMSLLYGNDFSDKTTLSVDGEFEELFESTNCFSDQEITFKQIYSAKELVLPQNLTKSCFSEMFCYCEQLVEGPKLPAVKLADWCYESMFDGCYALQKPLNFQLKN